jgi:hypothetical protein
VAALPGSPGGLWGSESQARQRQINEPSGQVRRLNDLSAGLQRRVDALTAANRDLREGVAAAEANAAAGGKTQEKGGGG